MKYSKNITICMYDQSDVFLIPPMALEGIEYLVARDYKREVKLSLDDFQERAYWIVKEFLEKKVHRTNVFLDDEYKNSAIYKEKKVTNLLGGKLRAMVDVGSYVNSQDDVPSICEIIAERRFNNSALVGFKKISNIPIDDKEQMTNALVYALEKSMECWESDPEYQKRLAKRKSKS